jgi:histone deacetylase complex regulatory component SIN3
MAPQLNGCGCWCVQVAVLFKNHNDLLTQFTYFLPDNSPPQVSQAEQQHISSTTFAQL